MEGDGRMEVGLAWLLRAAWIAGTLPILVASIPSSRLSPVHGVLSGFASRGKTRQSSSQKLTVPQSFFSHFYLVAVVWTTILLLATGYYAYKMAPLDSVSLDYSTIASHLTGGSHILSLHKSRSTSAQHRYRVWRPVFLLLLMELHVMRRLYETLYVFNYSSSARMHIFGYLTGLFFYIAAPLSLCTCCAVEVFNFTADQVAEINVEGRDLLSITGSDWWGYVKPITKLGWFEWIGAAIFIWGWVHQCRCHAILGSIRKERTGEYRIPHGDWFELVSSPHYLAEMVIYAGLLVASGGADFTIWLLFVFVVANLGFAATETQRWYLHKFEDYPRKRRACLPYIY